MPLGAVVIALGLRVIPADARARAARATSTSPGAMLVTGGLVGLTYGIVRTDTLGWGSPGVLVPLAAGVVLLAGVRCSSRRAWRDAPLVPLSIFRHAPAARARTSSWCCSTPPCSRCGSS